MTISTISLLNTWLDLFTGFNAMATEVNRLTEGSAVMTGNVRITNVTGGPGTVALNVANGYVVANVDGVYNIPGANLKTGSVKNASLQNSNIQIALGTAMHGAATVNLGSQITISLALAGGVDNVSQTAVAVANTVNTVHSQLTITNAVALFAASQGNIAYAAANTASDRANTARGDANTASDRANIAHGYANTASDRANTVYAFANTLMPLRVSTFGITANGTTIDHATLLSGNHSFQRVESATDLAGVRLPIGNSFAEITITNQTANVIQVYPTLGGRIGASAVNAAFTVYVGETVEFFGATGNTWYGQRGSNVAFEGLIYTKANTACTQADQAGTNANNAYGFANTLPATIATAYAAANTASDRANTARGDANTIGGAAFSKANTACTQSDAAGTQANVAFAKANSANLLAANAIIVFSVSGGSIEPDVGRKDTIYIPWNATIRSWHLVGTPAGNCKADLWRSNNAGQGFPSAANTLTSNNGLTILGNNANTKNIGNVFTSNTLLTGDYLTLNLQAVNTHTTITLTLNLLKTG